MTTMNDKPQKPAFRTRDRVQVADGRRGIILYFNYEKGQPRSAMVQINPIVVRRADKHRRVAGEKTTGGTLAAISLSSLTLLADDGSTLFEPAGCIGGP